MRTTKPNRTKNQQTKQLAAAMPPRAAALAKLREYIDGGPEPADLPALADRLCRDIIRELVEDAMPGDDPLGGVGGDADSAAVVASCVVDRLLVGLRAVGGRR